MHSVGRALFGTVYRRLAALVVALGAFYSLSGLILHYVDNSCSSAGLSLFLIALWFVIGIGTGFATILSLSDLLIGQNFLDNFLTDEMAQLDAKLSDENRDDGFIDDEFLKGGANETKFGILFLVFAAAHLVTANTLSDHFLQRYMHSGLALIKLRSADELNRRQGLDMLVERLDLQSTPDIERAVLSALDDPMEGVVVRAAHIAGTLRISAAASRLIKLVDERPELAFPVMIAIGQIGPGPTTDLARKLVASPAARAEPVAQAYMFGMLKSTEINRLLEIFGTPNAEEDARVAAIWALGQLRDNRLLKSLTDGLKDPALRVQCTAIAALSNLVATDSAPPLMDAFESEKDIRAQCPEILVPVQEGGPIKIVTKYRLKLFSIVRALATTDHPDLIPWLVQHQNMSKDYNTKVLMKKLWEKLKEKDARGELNMIRHRLRTRKAQTAAEKGGAAQEGGGSGRVDKTGEKGGDSRPKR